MIFLLCRTFTERDYVGLVLFSDRAFVPAVQCPGVSIAKRFCVEWDPMRSAVEPYPDGVPNLVH